MGKLSILAGLCSVYPSFSSSEGWFCPGNGRENSCWEMGNGFTNANLRPRARICKRLRRPGIDSEVLIPPAYVARRAGTTNRVVVPARQAGNRFLGFLKIYKYGLMENVNLRYPLWRWELSILFCTSLEPKDQCCGSINVSFEFGSGRPINYRSSQIQKLPCARIYRPSIRKNKPKMLVFSHWKRGFYACFRVNWVYKFGHWTFL